MYERNAIILERYFDERFGYNLKNNIKVNFKKYCELVEIQEKYKHVTEEEEETIIDYDLIANKIRDLQKKQQNLNTENIKYQQQRETIFENIDEDVNSIQRKFDTINQNIQEIDAQIKENGSNFISAIAEFSEKSLTRSKCGQNRRDIEFEYNNMLNETLDNYRNIDINIEQKAKQFIERDNTDVQEELKKIIQENGKKEKIPFNEEAIEQAIKLSIDIQKRENDILTNAYEKTNKLFAEIKSSKLKIDMHKKVIVDSKCKQEFLLAVKDYLVQFLDNERLAAVNGENEYNQLMKEACKNLNDDLMQINNLYTLLIKETTKKATKKMYNEIYKIEYLDALKKKSDDFESQVKKLKLPVTIINPNYWRIEGMGKIYDVFGKCVTEKYNRDLSEFITYNSEDGADDSDNNEQKYVEKISNGNEQKKINKQDEDDLKEESEIETYRDEDKELSLVKNEIDRKIDMILGLTKDENWDSFEETNSTEIYDNETYNELEDFSKNEEFDEDELDDTEDFNDDEDFNDNEDFVDSEEAEYENFDDSEAYEDEEYDSDEDEEWKNEETKVDNYNEWKEQEDYENPDDDWNENDKNDDYTLQDTELENVDYDIWGNNISKKNKKEKNKKSDEKKNKKDNKKASNWGDEFINIDPIKKKKKSFFNKFMK